MSEDDLSPPESSSADPVPEIRSRRPVQIVRNPAIGWLRFFVWLMPTGILIGSFLLTAWLESTFSRSQIWPLLSTCLGIAAVLSCGWFDSKLALICRTRGRQTGHHIFLFVVTQILVIPAVLFAALFAFCAAISL